MPPSSITAELHANADWLRQVAARLVLDLNEADDVVQEVFTAALTNAPAAGSPWRTWFRGVLIRVVASRRRKARRLRAREQHAAVVERQPSAASLAERAETQRRLSHAVFQLDPIYRDVLLLRFYDGLPPREIARILRIPVNTVRTRQARALALVRLELDRELGSRRRWCVALAPWTMTRPGVRAGSLLTTLGAIRDAALFRPAVAVVALTLAGGAWLVTPAAVPATALNPAAPVVRSADPRPVFARTQIEPPATDAAAIAKPSPPVAVRHGMVRDAVTGLAVANAQVSLGEEFVSANGETARTDALGRFVVLLPPARDASPIAPVDLRLHLDHPDYVPASVTSRWEQEVVVDLEPWATLSGVVLDARGDPVPGASLFFYALGDQGARFKTRTDHAGRFELRRLRGGRHHLVAVFGEGESRDKIYAHGSWVLERGEQREVTLAVTPFDRGLSGRVRSSTPDAPALVPLFFGRDPNGAFIVSHPEPFGCYRTPAIEPGQYVVLLVPADNTRFAEAPCSILANVSVGAAPATLDLEVPRGRVQGRLDAAQLEEVSVLALPERVSEACPALQEFLLLPPNARVFSRRPDSSGAFAIEHLEPGTHRLIVRAGEQTIATKLVQVQVAGVTDVGTWSIAPPER